MKTDLYIRILVAVLLVINAIFYFSKRANYKHRRIKEVEVNELAIGVAGYLFINVICLCLIIW